MMKGDFRNRRVSSLNIAVLFVLIFLSHGSYAADREGFLGLAFNTSADLFRMDYWVNELGGTHLYGTDYKSGFGGIGLIIRGHFNPQRRIGFGLRMDLNYSELSKFSLKQEASDPNYDLIDLDMSLGGFSLGFGGMLWYRLGPIFLQPYAAVKPLASFILNNGEGATGWSIYLGFETGLETQLKISEKVSLLFGYGYNMISTKNHKFEMDIEDYEGNIVYVTETGFTYKGYFRQTSYALSDRFVVSTE